MTHPPLPGLFITGTDTDAGKTALASALLRGFRADGRRPGAYKPAASGGDGDGRALWEAAGRPLRPEDVCPQSFPTPLAPHHAAAVEGRAVDDDLLVTGVEAWRGAVEIVVVEGAGGLFSPLSPRLLNADLARRLGFPLVVVDGGRLGCVGRVLAVTIAARASGLDVAAVVISQSVADDGRPPSDPTAPRRIAADGADELRRRLPGIPVALLGHGATEPLPALDWMALATHRRG